MNAMEEILIQLQLVLKNVEMESLLQASNVTTLIKSHLTVVHTPYVK